MEPGMIVIVVIVAVFYLRLYLVRRRKQRREQQAILDGIKLGKKAPKLPARDPDAPAYKVKSWWIIGPGIGLMLVGLAIYTQAFLTEYQSYWWIPVAVGGVLFIFGFE
jgi:hypothetical protein